MVPSFRLRTHGPAGRSPAAGFASCGLCLHTVSSGPSMGPPEPFALFHPSLAWLWPVKERRPHTPAHCKVYIHCRRAAEPGPSEVCGPGGLARQCVRPERPATPARTGIAARAGAWPGRPAPPGTCCPFSGPRPAISAGASRPTRCRGPLALMASLSGGSLLRRGRRRPRRPDHWRGIRR